MSFRTMRIENFTVPHFTKYSYTDNLTAVRGIRHRQCVRARVYGREEEEGGRGTLRSGSTSSNQVKSNRVVAQLRLTSVKSTGSP